MPLLKKKSRKDLTGPDASNEAESGPKSLAVARNVQAASKRKSMVGPSAENEAEGSSSSIAKDIIKKRSTELDFTKGGEGLTTIMYGKGKNDPEMEEKYFDGGEINPPDEEDDFEARNQDAGEAEDSEDDFDDMNKDIGESIASAIMRKRGRR